MKVMATCCPGLEPVLAGEIRECFDGCMEVGRGKVLFDAGSDSPFFLRCADNLYAHVGDTFAGPWRGDLPALALALAALPLGDGIAVLKSYGITAQRLHLSVSCSGKHSYSRFEAAGVVLPVLCHAVGAVLAGEGDYTCALRLDIQNDRARLYVKLTSPEFRFRGVREFSPAALRPTIAHALIRLSMPSAGDRFLDPCCGSGTLLAERAVYPSGWILGGDINPAAVASARANGLDAQIWDALHLPLPTGSIDVVVSNPPWGGQSALENERAFYSGLIAECRRVCVSGARVLLLTDRSKTLEEICQAYGDGLIKLYTLSLHGILAGIYCIKLAETGKTTG